MLRSPVLELDTQKIRDNPQPQTLSLYDLVVPPTRCKTEDTSSAPSPPPRAPPPATERFCILVYLKPPTRQDTKDTIIIHCGVVELQW